MILTARKLLHEILEGGDLDYQVYIVNENNDKALEIKGITVYDDKVAIVIEDDEREGKVIGSLEAIKDNLVNGRRSMYGVYEITKDLNTIIEALKKIKKARQ